MLDHLDRRRLGIEQAMWQAPALTVAAQAFLLFVLTDRSVDPLARGFILVAGIMASAAALLSLIRQRSREVLYTATRSHTTSRSSGSRTRASTDCRGSVSPRGQAGASLRKVASELGRRLAPHATDVPALVPHPCPVHRRRRRRVPAHDVAAEAGAVGAVLSACGGVGEGFSLSPSLGTPVIVHSCRAEV
jgi:hypothetical protein